MKGLTGNARKLMECYFLLKEGIDLEVVCLKRKTREFGQKFYRQIWITVTLIFSVSFCFENIDKSKKMQINTNILQVKFDKITKFEQR